MDRPQQLNLSNWRQPPQSRWAFHHVREVIPSEPIYRGGRSSRFESAPVAAINDVTFSGLEGQPWNLRRWQDETCTDALLVAHQGRLVHEWYAHDAIEINPHIVFSVSKSITATLAGVLVEQGLIDPSRPVVEYIPELAGSGFEGASLQHVLDMQVSIDFEEDYLATSGVFVDYRTATAWHPCAPDEIDKNLHDFLCTLKPGGGAHGEKFQYRSPNSDLLGWVLERASGRRLAQLLSELLWQPMGAEKNGYVTVDRKGAPRSAGGICMLPRDLLRFGEMVRLNGYANEQQVIPSTWIEDCSKGGSHEAWARGESSKEFARGQYRNKWYQTGDAHQTMLAAGIHGQYIYIDRVAEVTVVKLSSQAMPLRLDLDTINLNAFASICAAV
jgi:CubicO group peptidase (beta-lactamase class C family)